ncbi:fibronectin type III domain-containing protein [Cellulomonas sp. zg-ZUI199]|uniref:Fibronectin type III domain-containing protein n=1 Tax=Cellulomonas wangleii TaxID=2816956 RepID=A0ABX8D4P5_9CELL|nr:fibronectin type III domain-containing protein [Cellulomonas wangleii]MBO0923700.1 fibronectin type III domain-containing protein [Cellulomonas wangleii]MBO0923982.1 fibronectin type III domain-containing protein [Cellulomonas wangleii]QVI62013.1 fibronectin type III domain-containing protein [Cellulomonas wangleii]
MALRLPRRRPSRTALALALAVAATLIPASAAHADGTPGGTRTDPVPLPVNTLDGPFTAGNAHVSSIAQEGQQVFHNTAWYSFTPAEDVRLGVAATGDWDTALEVWADGTVQAVNDDWLWLAAGLQVDLTAGTEYLIGLGGAYTTSRGEATIHVSTHAPSTPTGLVVQSVGNRTVTLAWDAPADGTAIGYEVWCAPSGEALQWCDQLASGSARVTRALDGLTNGTAYDVAVLARNPLGRSGPSTPVTATPRADTRTTVTVSPGTPVAGDRLDVTVQVSEEHAHDDPSEPPVTRPATGTVDVVVAGTAHRGLPLVDGSVVLEDLTATGGTMPVTASYTGAPGAAPSSASLDVQVARRADAVRLVVPPLTLGATVRPVAESSSGLPVTLTATGACTVTDGSLTGTGAGDCTVTAATAGDRDTDPATASATVQVGVPPAVDDETTSAAPGNGSLVQGGDTHAAPPQGGDTHVPPVRTRDTHVVLAATGAAPGAAATAAAAAIALGAGLVLLAHRGRSHRLRSAAAPTTGTAAP